MFALTYFGAGFLFGWARPVPVVPDHFRDPQRGMAVVAVAGPLTNFLLALVLAAVQVHGPELTGLAEDVLLYALYANIVLGVFNLLPIPPLDGARIVGAVLHEDAYRRWSGLDQYGMVVLLALFVLFQGPFTLILDGATTATYEVVRALVGA
jgi:Zn-dependent protease